MCGIAGFSGKNAKKIVEKMLKILKHRGPDATGIYYDSKVKIIYDKKVEEKEAPPSSNLALGHNLLSIIGGPQPITGKGVLVFNGEIYNYKELYAKANSDAETVLYLIEKHGGDIEDALKWTVNKIDGDYAFAYFDGENIALVRDPVGVKPLYYSDSAFASERKALWKIGLKDIKSLKPGHALINNKLVKLKDLPKPKPLNNIKLEKLKNMLKSSIISAVEKRTRDIDKAALVFSGGVDSTLLAILLDKYIDVKLYTVGVPGSQDLKFALKAAKDLDMELKVLKIEKDVVKEMLPKVLTAIEEYNIMKIGVAMPLYIASAAASSDGYKVIFSGQGADELFAGYYRYKRLLREGKLEEALLHDLKNMYHVNLERDDAATMANSIELRVPFLDYDVIKVAVQIPIKYKIKDPSDILRKRILREIAIELGVPEYIAMRPKKAVQYGSGVDKILRKKVLPNFDHESFMKKLMSASG